MPHNSCTKEDIVGLYRTDEPTHLKDPAAYMCKKHRAVTSTYADALIHVELIQSGIDRRVTGNKMTYIDKLEGGKK